MNKVGEIVKLTETKLKYISKNNRGYYGIGASAVDYDKDKYTYLRITDINDDGTLNTTALMSVDDEKACEFLLKENDILMILGKGHEDYQIIGTEKIHFSDQEEVEKYIREHIHD